VHVHTLSLYLPSRRKLQCTLHGAAAERADTLTPYFISIPMYFVTPGLLLCVSEILTDLEEKENEVTGGQLKPTRAKRQIKGKRAKRQR
jgi:hypothetical protein